MSLSKLLHSSRYSAIRTRHKLLLRATAAVSCHCEFFSQTPGLKVRPWKSEHMMFVAPAVFIQRRGLFKTIFQTPGTGVNMPGQGLKKIEKSDAELEERSAVLRLITKWEKEQNEGMKKFPLLPDYKLWTRFFVKLTILFYIGVLLWPEFIEWISDVVDEPITNPAVKSTVAQSPIIYLYKAMPFRFISRSWGRLCSVELFPFLRPAVYGAYASVFNVNMEEALEKNFKLYPSLGEFFRRPLDLSFRPLDAKASGVFPCDGKVLSCGTVKNGMVEQVKGVTYSIQKFLGPLMEEPTHDNWGQKEDYEYNWSVAPLDNYHPALMKDPENNDLYHCVIYLGPGDYHRFHSPVEWTMKYRRHFPGDLLSVNPRIAKKVKDLFVLNERVVLSGTWEHGFFSVNPVGATNVGSIKVYEDVWLDTNRIRWKPGTYFESKFGEEGHKLEKGEALGEFNLGSTIVLVFEAPKNMKFNVEPGDSVKFGERLFLI